MAKPIELIALVCPKCSTPVPAQPDEVAWACAQCSQGLYLDDEDGLSPLEINYSQQLAANQVGKPYWVVEGQAVLQRTTYGSSGKNDKDAQEFWSQPRKFFVPAFSTTLESLLSQAAELLYQPPSLQAGSAARFEPVTLSMKDIPGVADFILMAIEAGRRDKLQKIEFTLQLTQPVLWILPAQPVK